MIETRDYWKNRIESAVLEYIETYGLNADKIKKIRWNAILLYIYDMVFKPLIKTGDRKRSYGLYSDDELLDTLSDLYISICYQYGMDISLTGYCYMIGIDYTTLYKRGSDIVYIDVDSNNIRIDTKSISIDDYKRFNPGHRIVPISNSISSAIREKLNKASEQALTSLTLDGSIPALAIGKIKHGWEEGKRAQVQAEMLTQAKNTADLLTAYKQKLLQPEDNT